MSVQQAEEKEQVDRLRKEVAVSTAGAVSGSAAGVD